MTEADFRVLLTAASFMAVRFGQRYVTQCLRFDFRYAVHLNQSSDDHATADDVLFPADNDRIVALKSEAEVIALLYREGRCPQWIDVSVARAGDSCSELRLLCCGRFTGDRAKMYYSDRGLGPFGVKSPALPPGYREGVPFSLPEVKA